MSTKTSPLKKAKTVIVKTFGQLNLGDKLYQVSDKGMEECSVTGINEDCDINKVPTDKVIITSGEARYKLLRHSVTGFMDIGWSCSTQRVFLSTSKQKAAIYFSLIKSTLLQQTEKAHMEAIREWEQTRATLDKLYK